MKKILSCTYVCIAMLAFAYTSKAQNWLTTGNSGLTTSNFLGTTDAKDVILKANNTEFGRLISTGTWRFGTSANNMQITSAGKMSFAGTGSYLVGGNKYAFQYSGNGNYGLFFNSTNVQYEFRSGTAAPMFFVNANNGNGTFAGTLKVGAYTFPSTDGLAGQVLKTNGAGALTWNDESGAGANTSLSNLTGTSINQSLLPNTSATYDFGSPTNNWANGYFSGAVQVGAAPASPTTGMIQWNGSDFQGYNGTSWMSLTSGGGSGYWAAAGSNIYNTNSNSVLMGPVSVNPLPGNKLQVGNPDDPTQPTFSGNDIAIYSPDGINGMSFYNNSTSSIWYSTGNFNLMPFGGNGYLGIGTTTPTTKLEVLTPDAKWGMIHTNGSTVRVGTYVGSGGGWVATQTNSPLYFCTGLLNANGSAQMTLLLNGNTGIGTINPLTKLQVQTADASYGITHTNGIVTVGTYIGSNGGWLGTQTNHPLYFFTNNSNALMTVATNGNVGIGTITPAYKLSVNGTIQAKEVRVETGWSDFVFEKNYKLRSLNDVEKYINQNHHLPNIASAKDIQQNGLPVAETETKMMQKIEELTLYVIQLQKQIDQLKAEKNESK